ncbi:RNA phosphotransferase [Cryptosporidium sp. chipmunk genotype I]|uniref:RNA phosphotransferase n=1 Tax=Cryptosporidium sp. chipmunk genotype I TaxID=1280935 RepID=UPI00351A6AFD|nr:RNA phosphotransferase [Cryptosporidium sp. chipmunk genotype I]
MPQTSNVVISKKLTWLLRHGDPAETGLNMRNDGFVEVNEILKKADITLGKLYYIVENDPKGRFKVIEEDGKNLIRANQGHSLSFIEDEKLLNKFEIDKNSEFIQRIIVHGTYLDRWSNIKENGLSRMSRSHIHFVSAVNFKLKCIKQGSKISEYMCIEEIVKEMCNYKCTVGIRSTSEILVFIDIFNCITNNSECKFYLSDNGVVLTRGNCQGLIDPTMFLFCIDIKNGEILLNNINDEHRTTEIIRFFVNSVL